MTNEDRMVLSNLLDKLNTMPALRDPIRYNFFLKNAIKEAEKRNAPQYAQRFKDMLISAKLSVEARKPYRAA